jgi:hypothetical protein
VALTSLMASAVAPTTTMDPHAVRDLGRRADPSPVVPRSDGPPRDAGPPRTRPLLPQEPFKGITVDGRLAVRHPLPERGFPTAEPVRRSAQAFLESLDDSLRARASGSIEDDRARRSWLPFHGGPRPGVSLRDMDDRQDRAAFELLDASLSPRGADTARSIMMLNGYLREYTDRPDEFGEDLFFFSIWGQPDAARPWGWRVDGHHLVIHYTVVGDQISMTPTFVGAEPARAPAGVYAGTTAHEETRHLAIELARSFSPAQRKDAVLSENKDPRRNILTERFGDNVVLPYEGITATALDARQQGLLVRLVEQYTLMLRLPHGRLWSQRVVRRIESTWFAWIGEVGEDAAFYFRIHSPEVLIEFDHLPEEERPTDGRPSRDHIHSVIRTPNGGDYGMDLLREHYAQHAHTGTTARGTGR